ncbi:MAG: hypothetical protein ACI4EH_13200 [Oliverpabstia sp.]
MAFSLVNGTGCQKSAQQDADLHAGIIGSSAIVLPVGSKCKAEIMSSNKVRVYDGEFISQGRRFNQPYGESADFTLENGSQGTVRYDIIGLKFSRDSEGKEACETFVHKNVGASGTVYEDDIREGATSSYVSMYRIKIDGINIDSVTPLFVVIDTVAEMTEVLTKISAKVGSKEQKGYFPTYNDDSHNVGMAFATLGNSTIMRAVLDGTFQDIMPNNKGVSGNYKIMDVVPSIVGDVWRLTFKIYVDEKIYEKYIELK